MVYVRRCTLMNAPSVKYCEACGGLKPGAQEDAFPSLSSAYQRPSGSGRGGSSGSGSMGAGSGLASSSGADAGLGSAKKGKKGAQVITIGLGAGRGGKAQAAPAAPAPNAWGTSGNSSGNTASLRQVVEQQRQALRGGYNPTAGWEDSVAAPPRGW